jgi:hypothetical protein
MERFQRYLLLPLLLRPYRRIIQQNWHSLSARGNLLDFVTSLVIGFCSKRLNLALTMSIIVTVSTKTLHQLAT